MEIDNESATRISKFSELTPWRLHELLSLRQEVFVVEQKCAYQDCDQLDLPAVHVQLSLDGKLVAYARILPAGTRFSEVSIGRVVTSPSVRGQNYGRQIMKIAMDAVLQKYGNVPVRISAQSHLQQFYRGLGFVTQSGEYLEDGIPHVEMLAENK